MAVASQQTTDQTTITVTDRGPGIPATQEEKIFRPFYRISDKVSEGVTGTGIGLSIARHLARLHGGDVVLILSTTGACFRVTLHAPRAEAARS
jgi:signal transduction histidine kinase